MKGFFEEMGDGETGAFGFDIGSVTTFAFTFALAWLGLELLKGV